MKNAKQELLEVAETLRDEWGLSDVSLPSISELQEQNRKDGVLTWYRLLGRAAAVVAVVALVSAVCLAAIPLSKEDPRLPAMLAQISDLSKKIELNANNLARTQNDIRQMEGA